MGSVVYCIHHKEGCQWSDELRKLKVRLGTINIYLDKRSGQIVRCDVGITLESIVTHYVYLPPITGFNLWHVCSDISSVVPVLFL